MTFKEYLASDYHDIACEFVIEVLDEAWVEYNISADLEDRPHIPSSLNFKAGDCSMWIYTDGTVETEGVFQYSPRKFVEFWDSKGIKFQPDYTVPTTKKRIQ
jgi:hypothetical protein